MRTVTLILSTLAVGLFCMSQAQADAMRCGGRLVGDGDPRALVRARCGDPADVQTHYIQRRPIFNRAGRQVFYGDGVVEVPVEVWTYNFGPRRLMYQVRFVDGRIDQSETLGYGYNEDYNYQQPRAQPRG